MLSKFIKVGDKIELCTLDKGMVQSGGESGKVYKSRIYDILSEDSIEILMPMEQTKLLLLPVDEEYNMIFYTSGGLYQCFARVADRYKDNNVYLLAMEFTSNLRKYQRREYYRFGCALEMCARNLEAEELEALENKKPCEFQENLPLKRSVIVDISGGGLRFMSEECFEPGSLIYCSYHLLVNGERKKYELIGKVLVAKELENRKGTFEHRVQYYNIDVNTREEIIRFIFEEERKNLRKE
ncbi:MAG: flagellar brake protein [Lachnospiraceae bacterium]|nr:flagellar brake protein [Lachnospiraceae bacterium]